MTRAQYLRASVLALSLAGVACGAPPQPTELRFEASLRVSTDDELPLAGARFSSGKQLLGTTSDAGTLTVRLRGSEGQTLRLSLQCPEGYSPPESLPPLRLTQARRVGETEPQPLSVQAMCTRQVRDVALIVRASNGSGLPVLVNGDAKTTTDADGNAHVLLKLQRDDRAITVKLDTTARPELKPAKPERAFELMGRDAVLLFEPTFTITPARRYAPRAAAAPVKHVPYRID